MAFLTRWFGVTETEAERDYAREKADIDEIAERSLTMQSNAAVKQHRALCRGTHAKGVCVRAQFEVFDVSIGRDSVLAERLAKGIFSKPGIYPAVARFANADASENSDFKPDVRALSFSVHLTPDGALVSHASTGRQDFAMQNATTLPINDSPAFVAAMKFMTASSPAACLWSLPFKDKLRVFRTLALAELQSRPKDQALPTTALLEHRTVSPRTERCRKALRDTVTGQPGASPAKKQPKGPAGRAGAARQRRRQDEQLRFRRAVSRYRQDDLLGQAPRCQLLDRERKCRVERSGSAFPHDRAAYAPAEFAAKSG